MPKNYFTGKEDDKARRAMIEQEVEKCLRGFVCDTIEQAIPVCISYNVMELKEGYDINDQKHKIDSSTELVKRFKFTEQFERFKRAVLTNKELLRRSAGQPDFSKMLLTYYVCVKRTGAIKLKDHSEGGFDITYDYIMKQSETLDEKTVEDILTMTPLVVFLEPSFMDRLYQEDRKILERMVDLGILRRNGELTVEFKLYLEEYCKDQFLADYAKEQHIKSISELGQSDDSDTDSNIHKLIILIALFIGMSPTEVMKLYDSKHRHYEAFDLGQIAIIVKQCLRVKEA